MTYAKGTAVPISRSRGEIDKTLRRFGASGVQWTDHWNEGRMELRFLWEHGEAKYQARFAIALPDDEMLRDMARRGGTGMFLQSKYDKLVEGVGREEMRLLAQFLKMSLHAIEGGLIDAEQLFLPFLEDATGMTVSERMLPRMRELLTAPKGLLLGSGQ